MPKFRVKTDQGTFEVELDSEPQSDEELNSLVTQHLAGSSTDVVEPGGPPRDYAAEHAANRAISDPTHAQAWSQFGTGVVKGAAGLPGKILEAGKGLYSMAGEEIRKDPYAGPMKALGKAGLALAEGIPAYAGEAVGKFIYGSPGDVGELVGENVVPLAAGKVLGKVLKTAPRAGELLKESAVKQYSKVLNEGITSGNRRILTERVVPELLERKVRATSRTGLEAKAAREADVATAALEEKYAALPQGADVRYQPMLDRIEQLKNDLKVKDTDVIVDQAQYDALERVQDVIRRTAGGTETTSPIDPRASVATTRSLRQQFEGPVKRKSETPIFSRQETDNINLAVEKEASNAVRNELGKEYPDIAEINKTVSLWLNVEKLVSETARRKAAHAPPLGERMLTAGGIAGGLASGGITKAISYATGLKALSKLINSTAWRTVSAVEKNRLANLLGAGKTAQAEVYASKLAGRGGAAAQLQSKRPAPVSGGAQGPPAGIENWTPEEIRTLWAQSPEDLAAAEFSRNFERTSKKPF